MLYKTRIHVSRESWREALGEAARMPEIAHATCEWEDRVLQIYSGSAIEKSSRSSVIVFTRYYCSRIVHQSLECECKCNR